jgi:uncharacterized coiled-coil protein SlyX
MKNVSEILALQTEIAELSKAMYKTWSRTGTTIRANEVQLKQLTQKLDQMIKDARTADEESARKRRLNY